MVGPEELEARAAALEAALEEITTPVPVPHVIGMNLVQL